jgi:GMC oxidoreductase/FAD binding domain
MISENNLPEENSVRDVCIIGAGPIGIALALECERLGLSVLLVEAGALKYERIDEANSLGDPVDSTKHAATEVAVASAFGGTSWFWGGRCLPLDPIDFYSRPEVGSQGWPISHKEVSSWHASAADFLGCGHANFEAEELPGWQMLDNGISFKATERWVRIREMARRYLSQIKVSTSITLLLRHKATKLVLDKSGLVTSVRLKSLAGEYNTSARFYVVACGGLGSTRLLLNAQREYPKWFGGEEGPLGHYYMGHMFGQIADIVLSNPNDAEEMDFGLDDSCCYVRRRFSFDAETLKKNELLNIHIWADNPAFSDAAHRNGVLSLAFLALAIPPVGRRLVAEGVRRLHVGLPPHDIVAHLANVLRTPFDTLAQIGSILRYRYFSTPRRPGFLVRNAGGRYALTYHSEQRARRDSKVWLSGDVDADGLRKLSINLMYGSEEANSVVRAHEMLDEALRRSGKGHLEYRFAVGMRALAVLNQASDGYHQLGTIRMGIDRASSVVDTNARVHDVANLFVASTAIFPTSGQANPTFTATALGLRLAHRLSLLRSTTDQGAD